MCIVHLKPFSITRMLNKPSTLSILVGRSQSKIKIASKGIFLRMKTIYEMQSLIVDNFEIKYYISL